MTITDSPPGFLGIDIGSLFLSLALVDEKGNLIQNDYVRHHGEPLRCLRGIMARYPRNAIRNIVFTGSGGRSLAHKAHYIDPIVAGVEAARRLAPEARNVLQIGGGSFSLTQLDETGRYRRSTLNSACASGTGAFLDQQALRLQVSPTDLARLAMSYDKQPPSVATRCAVFAKSDMIHLQQQGFTVAAIAAGLCAGLGRATVDGLLEGYRLTGKTLIIGGVAKNSVVVAAVKEKIGDEVIVPDRPELAAAYGAALAALCLPPNNGQSLSILEGDALQAADNFSSMSAQAASHLRPPLELKLSSYPDCKWADYWTNEDQSEIALATPRAGRAVVTMGIDIGSTSTKAVILDEKQEVVAWVYRKTAGDPIRAVQLVLKAFRELETRCGLNLDIRGVGTTGSGRKMIAALIGADLAINEITAHAAAAVFIDPEVDTIIELGGQDAKFTQLQNGMVYNSVMNYVCAAGTGSFIEEQALKLGIPLAEFAERAMGKSCPLTSDRCTVYMERDLDLLLARGWSKEQIAAAVLHSVRDNYLNKVVGGLHIGEHIYFQGATARNKALVAAFEAALGQAIKVSPYCHLTGALGMALLVAERVPLAERSRKFRGLQFAEAHVSVETEVCELCHNLCHLSLIHAGEETVAWGMKCGRDYSEKRCQARRVATYDAWKARESWWRHAGAKPRPAADIAAGRRVGILRSLGTYGYYPFWHVFLETLGCQVMLSPASSDALLKMGEEICPAEYCAPVLMSLGHARALLGENNSDYLFVPHMLREPVPPGFTDAHFCCYVQSHPSVLRALSSLRLGERLLAPVVQLNAPFDAQVDSLYRALGQPLGVDKQQIRRALAAAQKTHDDFRAYCLELGQQAMARLEAGNGLGIVCVGRPYNTTDPGLTLDLPRKIAELGYEVLFLDMLPYDLNDILPAYANMYWQAGQKILAAAAYIARQKRLFAIYFTNFMCGPDSYILTYFKEIMAQAGKPYLCLQFDGHGADAGYLTRVEAALESFHTWSGIPRPRTAPADTGKVAAPAAAGVA